MDADATSVLRELYAHRDDAFRLAMRITRSSSDAEDAVQGAFLRAARSQNVPPPAERLKWFLQLTQSAARDQMRAERRRRIREAAGGSRMGLKASTPDEIENLKDEMARALDQIDERWRVAISLRYEQGLSYAEAAEGLSLSEDALRQHVSRGLEKVREVLARQGYAVAPSAIVATLGEGFGIHAPSRLASALEHVISTGRLPASYAAAGASVLKRKGAGKLAQYALPAAVVLLGGVTAALLWMPAGPPSGQAAGAPAVQSPAAVQAPEPIRERPLKILRQFKAPAPDVAFVAYDGVHVWAASHTRFFYKLDPLNGTTLKTFKVELPKDSTPSRSRMDLAGGELYIYDMGSSLARRIDKDTGELGESVPFEKLFESIGLSKDYRPKERLGKFVLHEANGNKIMLDDPVRFTEGQTGYCFSQANRTIYKVDLTTQEVVAKYRTAPHRVLRMHYARQGTFWLVTDSNEIMLVDTTEDSPGDRQD